jgi:3-hydroxybutyryl-CoA dehydratase
VNKGDTFFREYRMTETIYQGFMALFGDRNPLHTKADFARQKGFVSEVMHGNILGGFISHFVGECLPDKNVIIHSQEIQYFKPSYLGDELRLSVEVRDVFESVGVVELGFAFHNQRAEKIAKGKLSLGSLA